MSPVLYTLEVGITAGRKYSAFAICFEKIVLLKQQTRVIMIDTNKAISGLFIPGPFLQINSHTQRSDVNTSLT